MLAKKTSKALLVADRQNRFPALLERLLSQPPVADEQQLLPIVNSAGVNPSQFQNNANSKQIEQILQKNRIEATAAQVAAPPVLFVNGHRLLIRPESPEDLMNVLQQYHDDSKEL